MVIFKSKQRKYENDLEMKLCGQTLQIFFCSIMLMIFP